MEWHKESYKIIHDWICATLNPPCTPFLFLFFKNLSIWMWVTAELSANRSGSGLVTAVGMDDNHIIRVSLESHLFRISRGSGHSGSPWAGRTFSTVKCNWNTALFSVEETMDSVASFQESATGHRSNHKIHTSLQFHLCMRVIYTTNYAKFFLFI